jgi:WD40 repeat protein
MARKGDILVSAVSDGTVRLNDARTLESVDSVDLHARRGNSAYAVAASATSPLIASADQRGSVLLWDMRHMETPVAECANPGAVHALAFVDDLVVSAGADGRLRAHASKDLSVEASASVLNSILCVKASGSRVASAGGTGKTISDAGIQLWRVAVEGGETVADGVAETRAEKRRKL